MIIDDFIPAVVYSPGHWFEYALWIQRQNIWSMCYLIRLLVFSYL